MKHILFICCIALTLFSCEDKTFEEVTPSTPVFYLQADINDVPISFSAGVNNYKLSFSTDQDFFGVYNYNSKISPDGCSDCGPAVDIRIFGMDEKGPNDNPNYPNDLSIGERDYITNSSFADGYTFHFFANENDNDLDHYWTFGDGGISTQTNPEHTYSVAGIYTIVHTIENENNISTTSSYELEVGSPSGFCSLPFRVDEIESNDFHFHHPFNMPDFLECELWTISNGNGQIIHSTTQSNFDFDLPPNDIYEVCLTFENEITDCEGQYCLIIDNTVPGPFSDPGFQIAPEPATPVIGKVLVEYRDKNGQLYRSAINANQTKNFEIVASDFYTPANSQSPISRKVKIVFDCTLQNLNDPDDIIELENGVAVFAFEIE
jgi:PKD repeat protein